MRGPQRTPGASGAQPFGPLAGPEPEPERAAAFAPGPPVTAVSPGDRATERVLRAQVRQEVSRLLDEQHLLRPRPEDETRIRVLIRERIAGFQRSAAVTNTPLIHDPVAMERRLFDGLLRLGPLQPLIDDGAVEEVIINHPRRVFCIAGGANAWSRTSSSTTTTTCASWSSG